MNDKDFVENVIFEELHEGDQASLSKTLTQEDINLFAAMAGDNSPIPTHTALAMSDAVQDLMGCGIWSGSLISTILSTKLPGPGTVYLKQNTSFKKPLKVGDTLTVTLTLEKKYSDKSVVTFDFKGINQSGQVLVEGKTDVLAPTRKMRISRTDLPNGKHNHDHFKEIIKSCQNYPPMRTAVVHPVKASSIQAVVDAVEENFIVPVLIGPKERIQTAAKEAEVDISSWEVIDTEHSDAAAAEAVKLAAMGKVETIMKGALQTHELMSAIIPAAAGLRTKYRISHAYVMDVPTYHKPLIVTDAAINIAPDAGIKADICQNAIHLWQALYGESKPKVAILAAVELVNPKMQATVDAAILCKMSDRGQIRGGILDGPLAFDNAINRQAALDKGIQSLVAGDADILLVPDIESGNILSKQFTFLGDADAAGIVLGARVPIILTSRSDSLRTRLFSCALAVKLAAARREGKFK